MGDDRKIVPIGGGHLETTRANSRGKSKLVTITVRVPFDVRHRMRTLAVQYDLTMYQLLTRCIALVERELSSQADQ